MAWVKLVPYLTHQFCSSFKTNLMHCAMPFYRGLVVGSGEKRYREEKEEKREEKNLEIAFRIMKGLIKV